jgi:TolB-like protein/DNA-binding winged helix-turn-helix (wHTH) protein/cytochrome c-type biogenesis protein CcmH/NrfG
LLRNGIAVPLAPKVFDTLLALVESGGRLMTKSELIQRLWPDTFVEEVSLAQNISQLRKALGNGAGDSKIIETVAKQGYRFAAPIQIVTPGTRSSGLVRDSMGDLARPGESPVPVHGFPRAARKGFSGWWVIVGAAALAAVGGFFVLVNQDIGKSGAAPAIRSIAVLPLANLSTDPEQEFLADGITDNLITELATVKALRVISRTSVMQYKGTRKTLPEIARELNVDALVEGTLSQHDGQLHVTAQLVQAIPEHHIWAETFERPLAEAQSVQSEIARQIVGALRATMTQEEQVRMRRSRATNSEAALLNLKGKYFWNKRTREGIREAEKYFQQAIAKDGDFAEAYVGLADVYTFEGGWAMEPANVVLPRAELAAQHALALDPDNAEAHATLGLIAMNYEWDWPKAEREFKQAIRLNSNDATAHHWYSEYLGAQGRFDEGLAELRRAEELDPLSLAIGADRGKMLYFARRYDESILQLHKTLEMDPGFLQAHFWLIRAYAQSGRQREADAALENLQRAGPDPEEYRTIATLVRAKAGRRKEAAQFADSVIDDPAIGTNPARMLHVQMAMGHLGEAFTWMEKCYASHSTVMTSLKVNPDYDGLRGDPRFAKYLERVGLSNLVANRGPG